MSARRLGFVVAFWVIACLLALTPVGGALGFVLGFGLAMCGAAAAVAIQAIARPIGFELSYTGTLQIIVIAGLVVILGSALYWLVAGALRARRNDLPAARRAWAFALSLVGFVVLAATSGYAVNRDWAA